MSEEQTFNEWVKQLEPSMAVPMYPKALLLDFMKKAFFAGLEQHSHDYLVKTKDLKANFDLAIEGRDIKIKELEQELTVQKDLFQEETNLHLHAEDYIKSLEQQIEKMKCCENCIHHSFWGNELKCNLMSYDDEFECLKTKSKWELDVK